jgi:DNA-binding response OmpR family regulator
MTKPLDPSIHDAPTQPLPAKGGRVVAASSGAMGGGLVAPADSGIVVVEHDPEQQTRLARSLTVRGARVVATSSPDAALTLMSHWSPGLVLVNDALPGASGLELARRIREDHPASQVVLMTSSFSEELRSSALMAGVLGLLVKPFPLEALFDLLGSLAPAE